MSEIASAYPKMCLNALWVNFKKLDDQLQKGIKFEPKMVYLSLRAKEDVSFSRITLYGVIP